MEHNGFPSDETLAAFLDGRLDPETRRRVIEHMTTCDECYSVVASGGGEKSSTTLPEARPARARGRSPLWREYRAAAAVIALLAIAWPTQRWIRGAIGEKRSASLMAQLAEAAPPNRITESRLEGFPYRPLARRTRGPSDLKFAEDPKNGLFVVAAARVTATAVEPTVKNLHALGVVQFVYGNFSKAVDELEGAIRKDAAVDSVHGAIQKSRDSALLNDLSAAYYARGRAENRREDFASAFEAASASWRLSKTSPAAWNRALALEGLNYKDAATQSWHDYERLDRSSDWSMEASSHLETKHPVSEWKDVKPLIQSPGKMTPALLSLASERFHQQLRTHVEETMLPNWAHAIISGDTVGASRQLKLVARVASALANTGDDLLQDEVQAIRPLSPGADLKAIAQAHADYGKGRELYRNDEIAEARKTLTAARMEFDRCHLPFRHLAAVAIASCDYVTANYAATLRDLAPDEPADGVPDRYPAARAQTDWLTGIADLEMGHPREALKAYETAAPSFQRAHELENFAATQTLIAQVSDYLGRSGEAWEHRGEAFQAISQVADARWKQRVFMEAAVASIETERYALAQLLLDGVIRTSEAQGDRVAAAAALRWRSILYAATGRGEMAVADLGKARSHLRFVGDEALRNDAEANLDLTAAIVTVGAPAIDAGERAVRHEVSTGSLFRAAEAQLSVSRAAGSSSRRQLATITATIDTFESRLGASSDSVLSSSPVVHRSLLALYDEAIISAVAIGDTTVALSYLERARVSGLTTGGILSGRRAALVTDLRGQLPGDSAILEFVLVRNHVWQWLVTRSGVDFHEASASSDEVRHLCRTFRSAVDNDERRAALQSGSALYGILIAPFEAKLKLVDALTLVPDDALFEVDFGGLWTGDTFLAERHLMRVVPSAGLHPVGRVDGDETQMLMINNPAASDIGYPSLPGADGESSAAARMHPVIISDRQATVATAVEEMSRASWIHFSGHADVIDSDSDFSSLIFADDTRGGSSRRLSAREIRHLTLPRHPVVILAACNSGRRGPRHLAAPWSLADAFASAGASLVIGNTALVYDETTPIMVDAFYGEVSKGVSPERALQRAQQIMIRAHLPLRSWSGFYVTS